MPRFYTQRALFEVRERPSRTYSWLAFMVSNIVVEIPFQIIASILVYACWYFPVFGAKQSTRTQGLMLVLCMQFYLFVSTFAIMVAAALPDQVTAANVSMLLFSMMITFNGVLQVPSALPKFWTFMWRVSPLTYLQGGWAATALADRRIQCSDSEVVVFDPPLGYTCGQYLTPYLQGGAPGQLHNPSSTKDCSYCTLTNANQFLAGSEIYPSQNTRDIGILFAYIGFNIFAAVALYYLFRVRQMSGLKKLRGLIRR